MLSERQVIDIFGALAQETRLRIVRALVVAGPDGLSAGALADALGVSPSNLSFHLRDLESARVISSRRYQRSIIYACVFDTLRDMQSFLLANCCERQPNAAVRAKDHAALKRKRPTKNGGH
jgi:ArsR family transcriptional regulator, arsenate/arsenite/antimonite-responsive transcriptional repressor